MWSDWGGMFRGIKPAILKKLIISRKILRAERRAKNILIHLSGGHTLIIHLKMTGHLMYGKWQLKNNKWTPEAKSGPLHDPFNRFIHILWTLSGGGQLAFADVRKFGKVEYTTTKETHKHTRLSRLGPEPLEISPRHFAEALLKKPTGKIKTVLMNQEIISGIGNIYSDEILWSAGIHPETQIKNIPKKKLGSLKGITQKILLHSIKTGGDSKSDYRNIYGEKGGFQNEHKAYRETGKPCSKGDGGVIKRIVIGGRSTHFCPKHQILATI